ncbi:MAG TPA: nucleotide sugar dehydrogenase [Pseudolabrys sp.]|nr:nucleotide sugar dehydrogenase [Pseudolabrys sp.]
MHISVVGLGKLGAPWVAVLASKGFNVIGVDRIPAQVAALQAAQAPVAEPGLQDLITQARANIDATGDIGDAVARTEMTFVVVPTPSGGDKRFSGTHVLAAVREIGAALRGREGYHLVVITSTVMPGATGGPIRQALEASSGRVVGESLGLCYNPEFIALGSVIRDMLQPDFILIGESDAQAGALLASIYERVCDNRPRIQRMNLVNAEITKIAVNSFVTTKISFANMVSDVCDRLAGADAAAVLGAVGCDTRIGGKYLAPALGYGGPCFPRDNAAFATMARDAGARADLPEATDAINKRQVERVTALVRSLLPGGTVGVLGLSYKPHTGVIEESQAVAIASQLAAADYRVIAHDPQAGDAARSVLGSKVEIAGDAESCVRNADLLIVATPWPAFREIPRAALRRANGRLTIIDCWRVLPAQFADDADVFYLGRHASSPAEPATAIATA